MGTRRDCLSSERSYNNGVSEGVNFLNLEYLLTRVFDLFGSFDAGGLWSALPGWMHFFAVQLAVWGLIIALILLLMIVYAQIRLTVVEHEGFHGKEEHQVLEVESAPPPQNERWRRVVEL